MKKISESFKNLLRDENISFEKVNGRLIINGGYVDLRSLTGLPENIQFNNGGDVYLRSLTSLPENIQFNNGGDVNLSSLTSLPENIQFNNGGYVNLSSLTSLPENIQFNNGGDVYLRSLTSLPENIQFNNGGDVDLSSLTSLPENIQFNNGGDVYLRSKKINVKKSYIERFNLQVNNNNVFLFKRISENYKTQENTLNETLWLPGTIVEHKDWMPEKSECGEGKFHACAKPYWCDCFRNKKRDRYISILVNINDLFEWKRNPSYPQKIGFRKALEIKEVDRMGNIIIKK